MSNKVIITQSNYIPWKGYFTTMKEATHVVLYDDAQYTRRDWRNRNKIITPNGPDWLSIPIDVKGKYHQKVNEAKVKDLNWSTNHWNKITQNYKKAPYFNKYSKYFSDLYLQDFKNLQYLSDINKRLLVRCTDILGIEIDILDSREFNLKGNKTQKLINICKDLNAAEYFTGPAALDYIEEDLFDIEGIKLSFYNLDDFPTYQQQWHDFDHHVSILDMFFNLGDETQQYFNWI